MSALCFFEPVSSNFHDGLASFLLRILFFGLLDKFLQLAACERLLYVVARRDRSAHQLCVALRFFRLVGGLPLRNLRHLQIILLERSVFVRRAERLVLVDRRLGASRLGLWGGEEGAQFILQAKCLLPSVLDRLQVRPGLIEDEVRVSAAQWV